jgi:SAM-dependent methyltransferase
VALWLIVVLAVLALVLGALTWWRLNPSACPYGLRIWVQVPHPLITRKRLLEILAPRPPERILEIGPGTGYYTLDVAEAVAPRGRVDTFDLQQEMLDHTMRRAAERGIENIKPRQGDARDLPYGDNGFDAAFLVTVFGEIPDADAALRELRRVVRPGGRVVVGELSLGDPHFTRLGNLRRRAEAAGLSFERRIGGPLGYFARFTRQR